MSAWTSETSHSTMLPQTRNHCPGTAGAVRGVGGGGSLSIWSCLESFAPCGLSGDIVKTELPNKGLISDNKVAVGHFTESLLKVNKSKGKKTLGHFVIFFGFPPPF